MKFKKRLLICLITLMIPLQSAICCAFAEEESSSLCELRYYGVGIFAKKNVSRVTVNVEWDDNYLWTDSSVYNHNLSKVLSLVATGAYYGFDSNDSNLIYNFNSLGFSDIENNYKPTGLKYDNTSEYYDEDGVSYGFAKKETILNGTEVTIIGVAIKGTDDEEWVGNFNIGDGESHKGFFLTGEKVYSALNEYVSKYCTNDNIKIFVTGHSRGAAIANVLGAILDMKKSCGNVSIEKKDIFCYTYACPSVTTLEEASSDDYNNIFNIINPNDLIIHLPLSHWNFKRYGTDLVFPDLVTNKDYLNIKEKVNKEFEKLTGNPEYLTYAGGNADIISYLSKLSPLIDTTYDYYNKEYNINGEQKTIDKCVAGILTILTGGTSDKVSALVSLSSTLSSPFGLFTNFFVKNVISSSGAGAIVYNHAPEIYISYLFALDEETLFSAKLTKKISFDVNCNVTVTNISTGKTIAKIQNGNVLNSQKSLAIIQTNNLLDLYLPSDENFSIEITNITNNNFDISYNIISYDARIQNSALYSDIYLKSGDSLIIDIYDIIKQIEVRNFTSGKKFEPNYTSFDKSHPDHIVVDVQKTGIGDFICSTSYEKGSTINLKAYAYDDKYTFAGYDVDGFHKSKEINFSFIADKDMSINCVFLNMNDVVLGDCDNDKKITMADVVLVQKYIAKLNSLDTLGVYSADVNYDENISMLDVTYMQLYIAKLVNSFEPSD